MCECKKRKKSTRTFDDHLAHIYRYSDAVFGHTLCVSALLSIDFRSKFGCERFGHERKKKKNGMK